MIIAKRKISKNDKAYLDFSYKTATADDVVELSAAQPQAAAAPVVTANVESNDSEDDDVPFDI